MFERKKEKGKKHHRTCIQPEPCHPFGNCREGKLGWSTLSKPHFHPLFTPFFVWAKVVTKERLWFAQKDVATVDQALR